MPALNFKSQFVPKIKKWEKLFTIRKQRKNPIKIGDTLYLYTGMRTSNCKLIATVQCTDVTKVKIEKDGIWFGVQGMWVWLTIEQLHKVIVTDGFNDFKEMADFFRKQYGLPFEGVLIAWTKPNRKTR